MFCAVFHVDCSWGGGGGGCLPVCGGVGPFLPFFMVSSRGFPARGRFYKFRFRDGCFIGLVSCVPRSFSVAL